MTFRELAEAIQRMSTEHQEMTVNAVNPLEDFGTAEVFDVELITAHREFFSDEGDVEARPGDPLLC